MESRRDLEGGIRLYFLMKFAGVWRGEGNAFADGEYTVVETEGRTAWM